jgi:hypothetical protein
MQEAEEIIEKRTDPMEIVIDPPESKKNQYAILPKGSMLSFAMCTVIANIGKKQVDESGRPVTQMEQFMNNIYGLSRSKDGVMLSKVLQLAETKLEVSADEEAQSKRYIV